MPLYDAYHLLFNYKYLRKLIVQEIYFTISSFTSIVSFPNKVYPYSIDATTDTTSARPESYNSPYLENRHYPPNRRLHFQYCKMLPNAPVTTVTEYTHGPFTLLSCFFFSLTPAFRSELQCVLVPNIWVGLQCENRQAQSGAIGNEDIVYFDCTFPAITAHDSCEVVDGWI